MADSPLSEGLSKMWDNIILSSIEKDMNDEPSLGTPIVAKPYSGSCMFCGNELTDKDDDHSVCNPCWSNIYGEQINQAHG